MPGENPIINLSPGSRAARSGTGHTTRHCTKKFKPKGAPGERLSRSEQIKSTSAEHTLAALKQIGFDKKTPIELPSDVVQATLGKYQKIFELLVGRLPEL